jgi:hypothetical protein
MKHACFAFGLCLLAFLFAVEAKTAWFGPIIGPGSNVRAAKALPESSPRVVEHGFSLPIVAHPGVPYAALTCLVIASIFALNWSFIETTSLACRPLFSEFYFSPPSFFRPPPIQ